MTPQDRIARAQKVQSAQEVLEPAIDAVRDAALDRLIRTPLSDRDNILALHAAVQAVDAVKKALLATLVDGQVADIEIQHTAQAKG